AWLHVRRVAVGLPLDVAPIRGVRPLDQSGGRVTPLRQHPVHGPIQPIDQALPADLLFEPGRVGLDVVRFGGGDDGAGLFVGGDRGLVDFEVRADRGRDRAIWVLEPQELLYDRALRGQVVVVAGHRQDGRGVAGEQVVRRPARV